MRANRSVDELIGPTVRQSEDRQVRDCRIWPLLAALVAYPLLKYGWGSNSANILSASLAMAASYAIGIYLYYGVARLASRRMFVSLVIGTVSAGIAGALVCSSAHLTEMVIDCGVIVLAGSLVGNRSVSEHRQLRLYLYGLAVVVVGGLAMLVPLWPELIGIAEEMSETVASDLRGNLVATGYHAETADLYVEKAREMMNMTIRILPAATLMNLVVQFSVGFLWFLRRGLPTGAAPLRPFSMWIVPFWLTPALVLIILARVFGGGVLGQAADNVLMILSIYYCVGGLAFIEHLFGKVKVVLGVKVLFYIMLTITGLLGYLAIVLLGFVDSFADWRKVARTA